MTRRRAYSRFSLLTAFAVAFCPVFLCGQQSSPSTETAEASTTASTLFVQVLDSRSGAGIKPDTVRVDGSPARITAAEGSIVQLDLPDGTHAISITAEGYDPMEFSATVSGADTPVVQVEMDSMETPDYEPVAPDAAILEGHVTDRYSGEVLPNVAMTLAGSDSTTRTDANGYYRFDLLTGASAKDEQPVIALEVKAEGYAPLRMKNISLAAGQRRRMAVRLDPVTSETESLEFVEIDEKTGPGGRMTVDWTFDVTVR